MHFYLVCVGAFYSMKQILKWSSMVIPIQYKKEVSAWTSQNKCINAVQCPIL